MKNIKNILSSIQFFLLTAVLLLSTPQFTWAITSSYYSALDGKSGATLFTQIGTVANTGYSGTLTYSGIWTAYNSSDKNSSGKIWDIYSNCTFTYSTSQCGTYSNVCDCYNREHSVPQNWFGSDVSSSSKGVAGTDMFHVYPTDGKVNGMRSNYPYGETSSGTTYGTGRLGNSTLASSYTYNGNTYTTTSYSGTVFEPADDYKGDLARSYFYMIAFWGKYKGTNFSQGTYGAVHFNTTYTSAGGYGLTAYSIGLLMKWHRQDPVSQKEIDRNNALNNLSGQGNRNPFIDYPCLAEYLWGDKKDQTFNLSDVVGSFESGFTVGSSSGCSSGGTTTNYTITWMVNGSQWASTTSSGSSVGSMPNAPTVPTACDGKVFVGWSKTNIGSTGQSSAPSDLFTTASDAPTISGNTTFYAVFATASSGSGSSGSETLTCSAGTISNDAMSFSTTNFSVVHAKGTGSSFASYSPWRVYTNNTVTISGSKNITSVVITCSSNDYATAAAASTLTPSSASASASGSTCTITTSGTSLVIQPAAQTRWSQIVINYGSATTYSGYVTTCSSSSSCTSNPTLGAASSGTTTTTTAPATCSNGITSLGSTGCTISSYGFVYGTSSNPTLDNGTKVQVGTSYTTTGTSFNTTITGLTAGTSYYIRPYATNGNGTGYGSQTNVTTKSPTSYVVTWKVNGSTYTTGGPTTSVVEGNKVTTLPTAPSAPSACSEKTFVGWSTTNIGSTATSTAPSDLFTTAEGSPTITAATIFYAVFMSSSGGGSSVTDNITLTTTGVSSGSTTYSNWTATGTSGAAYAGNSAGGNAAIQMRSNNSTSGIVTTTSGGTASNVTVTWLTNDGNNNRTVNVYGKNTAYSAASDLYNTSTQGTLLGSATYGTSTSITVSGSYTYIGLRSNSGALYLTNVAVTWGGSGGTTEYVTECAAAATYTITWNATQNGGTCSTATSTITAGNAVGTLPTATKDCNTFNGWYTQATGGTKITTSTVPTGSVTYYAQYTINSHTLSVVASPTTYGTVSGGGSYNCGTSHTITATANTGYAFSYWSLNSSSVSTSASYSVTMPDENVTYTAIFVAGTASYTVKHYKQNTDGSTYPSTPTETETKNGTTGGTTAATAKSYTGFTAQSFSQATIAADGSTVVSIYYKRDTYTIYYYRGNYGTGTNTSATKLYGVDLTLPSTAMFTRSGYVQTGWSTSAAGTTKAYDLGGAYTANSGTTLYPYWTAVYTITWNATTNGGTCSTTTSTVTAGDAVGTLPSATKDCYTLKGWYTTATGNTQVTATTVPTGSVTYYAQFIQDTYTINYDKGSYGTGTNTSATKNCGENLTLPGAIFTRSGYVQTGWSTSAAGTTKAYDLGGTYTANSGTTLYPYWTAVYTITWNATTNGGTCSTTTSTVTAGDAIGTLPSATKDCYTLKGWYTTATGNTQVTTSTVPTGNVTYYAQFTQDTYTINYNKGSNGTGTNQTATKYCGENLTLLGAIFTRSGYTQKGWSTSAAGTSKAYDLGGTYTTDAGTTLYPYWVINRTVTWNATTNGGTCSTSTTTVPSGDAVGELPTATKEGATFNGWFTQATGGTQITASTTITANVTYYAQFSDLPTYTVTFVNGSSTYTTESGWAGKSITVTDPTPCDGFTFVGWSTQQYSSDNTTTPTIDYNGTVPSGNTTYYAVYSLQGNPTTTLTNNYAPITSLDDLTEGNYLVVGYYNSNYYAMRAAQTGTYYLNQTQVYPSSNVISSPAANLIWQVMIDGNSIKFWNSSAARYAYAYRATTRNYLNLTNGSTGISFTPSVSSGVWTFTSDTYTTYRIMYQGSNSRFGLATSATNDIYLYKQQTQTTYTTYYTTDTSFTIEANPNNTTYGSTSITEL